VQSLAARGLFVAETYKQLATSPTGARQSPNNSSPPDICRDARNFVWSHQCTGLGISETPDAILALTAETAACPWRYSVLALWPQLVARARGEISPHVHTYDTRELGTGRRACLLLACRPGSLLNGYGMLLVASSRPKCRTSSSRFREQMADGACSRHIE